MPPVSGTDQHLQNFQHLRHLRYYPDAKRLDNTFNGWTVSTDILVLEKT